MFYRIENQASGDRDLYVYGDIVSEKEADWWTGEISENDTDMKEFRDALDGMTNGQTLRMYVNSGGGSVFAASTMVSMMKRAQGNGVKIESYIDGLAASAASWLALAADVCHIYRNSMMMVHKPLTFVYGNADELQRQIVALDSVENGVMMPIYMAKAKISENEVSGLIAAESWLTSAEIAEAFEVVFEDEEKQIAACVSDLFKNYRNVPDRITKPAPVVEPEPINYAEFENAIKEVKNNA